MLRCQFCQQPPQLFRICLTYRVACPFSNSKAMGMKATLPMLRFPEGTQALEKSVAILGQARVPRTFLAPVNADAEPTDENFDYGGDVMLCLVPDTANEETLLCSLFAINVLQCLNNAPDRPGMFDNYISSVCLFRSNTGPYQSKFRTDIDLSMPVCKSWVQCKQDSPTSFG